RAARARRRLGEGVDGRGASSPRADVVRRQARRALSGRPPGCRAMISVVCPFFNEEAIIDPSVRLMLQNLATLSEEWELIIVNDGSRDRSLELARALEAEDRRLRGVSYPDNRGRGYAIRTGVGHARGDLVLTTEIDSSWGDDICVTLAAELRKRPDADIVIASPHLPGGGYRNVPLARVLLSTAGNYVIRSGLTYSVTMHTGMTRGYRREK